VGASVGPLVRGTDGIEEGEWDGWGDGNLEGEWDGWGEGSADTVGLGVSSVGPVGALVGDLVGPGVGGFVGRSVGAMVGGFVTVTTG
jgi:hypothetical protein